MAATEDLGAQVLSWVANDVTIAVAPIEGVWAATLGYAELGRYRRCAMSRRRFGWVRSC